MTILYRISSILMAALFLVSTCVQFNDPDWYFWILLYSCATYVNLMRSLAAIASKKVTSTTKVALWLGIFLLCKVLLEDYLSEKIGIWSLDMRHRLIREKIGSGLVISSMMLQLAIQQDPSNRKNIEYGMAVLVGISYGLSLVFVVYHEKEMKF